MIELDIQVTPQAIKDLMLGNNVNKQKHMFIELFKRHNEQIKALVGKEYAQGTYQIFNRTLNHTVDFLNRYFKVSDTDIKKLSPQITQTIAGDKEKICGQLTLSADKSFQFTVWQRH